jgi:tetratricopeptide (TPR) repeat protein
MLNRYDDAIEQFSEALKIDPALTPAALRRGVCWYYKDEYTLAQADFEDASGGGTSGDTSTGSVNSACPLTWKGMTLVKLGRVRDAVNTYSEALRYDNRYAPAHVNRGLAYVALREYDKAVADFDQAIRSTPKDASLYFKRGVAQGGLGDWRGAVKSFTEAVRINPNYADAYSNRSAAYRRLGDEAKAQADAAKSGELKSTTARAAQSAAR